VQRLRTKKTKLKKAELEALTETASRLEDALCRQGNWLPSHLSIRAFYLLFVLHEDSTLNDLAKRVGREVSDVRAAVKELTQKGYVEKRRDLYGATANGRRLVNISSSKLKSLLKAMLNCVPDSEQKTFDSTINEILSLLGERD